MGTEGQATRAGWWTESVSDGGAHYGTRQSRGKRAVYALCGRVFEPLGNPWAKEVKCQQQPADSAHACHVCKKALHEQSAE